MVRAVAAWILKWFHLEVIAQADLDEAREQIKGLNRYARKSGALSSPQRVNARARIITVTETVAFCLDRDKIERR